jgi:hypothetical protein
VTVPQDVTAWRIKEISWFVGRRPTLAESTMALQDAEFNGCRVVVYRSLAFDRHNVARCDCGEVVINNNICRWCRAIVIVTSTTDEASPQDFDARQQLAERILMRLAGIIATFKPIE